MSLEIRHDVVFTLRLTERPMPTGSNDSDVLLDWLLDSMGLVVRRTGTDESGALHRIMMDSFLESPLRGWDSKELGDITGISNTAIHHQVRKLRQSGLVAAQVDGKWHRYVLRGGSMEAAAMMVESQAKVILGLRLSELAGIVEASETRMAIDAEEDDHPLTIRIAEPGPIDDGDTRSALVRDLGLAGESKRVGESLAREVLVELCSNHNPITMLALSERLSESRGRVSTVLERMRAAQIIERAPMVDRLPQDVYAGLTRQHDARGADWLMARGGLGRLQESVSGALIEGVSQGSLSIDSVRGILEPVALEDQRILLNQLGGRTPYGYRVAGADGESVSIRVMRQADRTLRRIRTVAKRLDDSLAN